MNQIRKHNLAPLSTADWAPFQISWGNRPCMLTGYVGSRQTGKPGQWAGRRYGAMMRAKPPGHGELFSRQDAHWATAFVKELLRPVGMSGCPYDLRFTDLLVIRIIVLLMRLVYVTFTIVWNNLFILLIKKTFIFLTYIPDYNNDAFENNMVSSIRIYVK